MPTVARADCGYDGVLTYGNSVSALRVRGAAAGNGHHREYCSVSAGLSRQKRCYRSTHQRAVASSKTRENGCGLKLVPGSLLEDVELRDVVRPVSHKIEDWPQVFFQSGLFNVEFRLLLDRCEEKETNIGWHTFRDCSAADWKFPKDHAADNRSLSKAMFSEAREKACAKSIRFRITEVIIAFPVRAETASWRALCDMIDAILAIKKGCNVDRPSLGKMQPKHITLFVDIYGESNLIPKHHSPISRFQAVA